jgi:hypothetical protein
LTLMIAAAACGGDSPVSRFMPQRTPHEAFAHSLKDAGLDKTAMGEAWLAKAGQALQSPHPVTLPFRESGYFEPALPAAVGYRFDLPRGRALAIDVALDSSRPGRLFIDLFRVTESGFDRVASADDGRFDLRHVSRGDGAYVLRLQPELLTGGRYAITQRSESSLRFPVQGLDERAIHSVFGDARDGGRRDHHGVDIFAPRGTPVVAAIDGLVSRVDTTDIGGRVIWVYDSLHGQSLYYAHLNDWAVRSGQNVQAGEVLGYVGNTGNARSTPPHLHFGIYSRGPIDPLPAIRAADPNPPAPAVPAGLIGRWGRTARETALFAAPVRAGQPVARLPAATVVHLRAAAVDKFRVALPDGREGFVAAAAIQSLDRPLRTARLRADAGLRDAPAGASAVIAPLRADAVVTVFAAFNGHWLARAPDGTRGWVDGTMIRP